MIRLAAFSIVLANLCFAQEGSQVYISRCLQCHSSTTTTHAPTPEALSQIPWQDILKTLETGVMKVQADNLSQDDRIAVARYVGKEAGAQVLGKAKEAAGSVGDMAAETVSAVGQKADDVTASAGHEIKEFGETIRKKGPHEGFAGQASQAVADTIRGSGKYIEDAKLSGMAHDVEQVIKTHPIPSLLICLGIGFCIGRAMKD